MALAPYLLNAAVRAVGESRNHTAQITWPWRPPPSLLPQHATTAFLGSRLGHSLGLGGFRFWARGPLPCLEQRPIPDYRLIRLSAATAAWARRAPSRRAAGIEEHFLESKEQGPQAYLDFLNQRLAKRQNELEQAIKFSSHYNQLELTIVELKTVRAKYVSLMRREGLL